MLVVVLVTVAQKLTTTTVAAARCSHARRRATFIRQESPENPFPRKSVLIDRWIQLGCDAPPGVTSSTLECGWWSDGVVTVRRWAIVTLNSKEAGSLVSSWSYNCGVQRASRDDVSPHSNTPVDSFAPTTATRAASVRTLIIFVELLRAQEHLAEP